MLDNLLQFNPEKRLTAEQALGKCLCVHVCVLCVYLVSVCVHVCVLCVSCVCTPGKAVCVCVCVCVCVFTCAYLYHAYMHIVYSAHPYMHELHDIDDEPAAPEFFDFGFEKEKDVSKIRQLVVQEVCVCVCVCG